MESIIQKQTNEILIINWTDSSKGFGQLTLKWDGEKQEYILDSELIGIETILSIFKSLK